MPLAFYTGSRTRSTTGHDKQRTYRPETRRETTVSCLPIVQYKRQYLRQYQAIALAIPTQYTQYSKILVTGEEPTPARKKKEVDEEEEESIKILVLLPRSLLPLLGFLMALYTVFIFLFCLISHLHILGHHQLAFWSVKCILRGRHGKEICQDIVGCVI